MYDELETFLNWWLALRPFDPPTQEPATEYADNVTATTLFRSGQYQVQMIVVPPNHVIPPHVHPKVDSFEVFVSGDIQFVVDGILPPTKPFLGQAQRVRPNDVHWGEFGPRGGVFLSVQRWEDGTTPTSVGYDWAEPNTDRSLGSAIPFHLEGTHES